MNKNKVKQKIDIDTWVRKDHYRFFKNFDEPFYGVCVNIDCTKAYQKAKTLNTSFFLYYLYQSTLALNGIDAFRYRIEDNEVYLYEVIDPEATVDRPDGTFGFSHIDFYENYNQFAEEATKVIDKVRHSKGLELFGAANVIHYSAVPWIDFTSISHARNFMRNDSCPKISFGKMTEVDGKRSMPMSVHVHHALVDGRHVGQFIDEFQRLMNE